MPNPVEKRDRGCRSCCCPCRYPHPESCPRCGSHQLIHKAGGFLGCWFCGLWSYELRFSSWQPLRYDSVEVQYPRRARAQYDRLIDGLDSPPIIERDGPSEYIPMDDFLAGLDRK